MMIPLSGSKSNAFNAHVLAIVTFSRDSPSKVYTLGFPALPHILCSGFDYK